MNSMDGHAHVGRSSRAHSDPLPPQQPASARFAGRSVSVGHPEEGNARPVDARQALPARRLSERVVALGRQPTAHDAIHEDLATCATQLASGWSDAAWERAKALLAAGRPRDTKYGPASIEAAVRFETDFEPRARAFCSPFAQAGVDQLVELAVSIATDFDQPSQQAELVSLSRALSAALGGPAMPLERCTLLKEAFMAGARNAGSALACLAGMKAAVSDPYGNPAEPLAGVLKMDWDMAPAGSGTASELVDPAHDEQARVPPQPAPAAGHPPPVRAADEGPWAADFDRLQAIASPEAFYSRALAFCSAVGAADQGLPKPDPRVGYRIVSQATRDKLIEAVLQSTALDNAQKKDLISALAIIQELDDARAPVEAASFRAAIAAHAGDDADLKRIALGAVDTAARRTTFHPVQPQGGQAAQPSVRRAGTLKGEDLGVFRSWLSQLQPIDFPKMGRAAEALDDDRNPRAHAIAWAAMAYCIATRPGLLDRSPLFRTLQGLATEKYLAPDEATQARLSAALQGLIASQPDQPGWSGRWMPNHPVAPVDALAEVLQGLMANVPGRQNA